MADEPISVLFACTSNALRSPLAAALMRMRYGSLARVESIGVRPVDGVDQMAAMVADERGLDITGHRPKGLEALEDEPPFNLIVSLSPEAHHAMLDLIPQLAAEAEYWPTFDPSLAEGSRDQRLEEYRMVRDGLDRHIAKRFPRPSAG